jgi:hypothetical protein
MTAKTSDFSGLLYYNPAGPGFDPVPQVTIHCPDSMDEGSRITVDLVTWGIPAGTVLRHVFPLTNLTGNRFNISPISPVANNRASFFIEVSANHITSGATVQSFDIVIEKTLTGPVLATKAGIIVNDTSLTPVKPTGLIRKTYSGYFYTGTEASQWFKDKTPIDTLTGAPLGDGDPGEVRTQHLSYEWVGYFSPPATDDYTFYVNSDDYTLVWIGSNAVSAYTNSNADITCPTSQSRQSSAISLTGGDFVPIRIQFGNDTGGGELHVSWSSTQHPTPSRNFDWLIYHDTEAVPTYTMTTAGEALAPVIDEGAALTFNVTTTGVADGTTLYWDTGDNFNGGSGRFSPGATGTVTISSNAATFTITVSADNTTAIANPQKYGVHLYTGNYGGGGGTQVAFINDIVVNDTSQTRVQLTSGSSLLFSGTNNEFVQVTGTVSDWIMGDNWCVEWWEKMPDAGADAYRGVIGQIIAGNDGLDIWHNGGNICVNNAQITFAQPSPGEWHHVVIQKYGGVVKAYIDGVSQTLLTNPDGASTFTNASNYVMIGNRTFDGNFAINQTFKGELANIRISSGLPEARYSATFTPPTTVTVDGFTRLALDGSVGASGMLDDVSPSNHTIINNGAVETTIGTATYTVRQYLYGYNPGNSDGNLYVLDADYPDVATIPVGATATINGTLTTVTYNQSNSTVYFNGGTGHLIGLAASVGSITAGTSITFTWLV